MAADPIVALESLGYTGREAAFLYLAAAHSGYFLRRQFDYFTDRNKGALVMRFLKKARALGHLEVLDYGQGWHVYHLPARAIYRILGDPESQHRRRKGDAQIRAWLMALDYVLENDGDHFLAPGAEKARFLMESRGIAVETIPFQNGGLHPLFESILISLADRTRPAQSLVRFAFIDEGLSTTEKFLRFLLVGDPLLRTVGHFEVVYVADSEFNFSAAEAVFRRQFLSPVLREQSLFDTVRRHNSRATAALNFAGLRPEFSTLLLRASYPRLRRNAGTVLTGVHI
jgi:hypothetical protein